MSLQLISISSTHSVHRRVPSLQIICNNFTAWQGTRIVSRQWLPLTCFVVHTKRCRYNAVNFDPNPDKRHLIARPWGRDMGCLLWILPLMEILPQSLSYHMQIHVLLDRVITALDSILSTFWQISTRYLSVVCGNWLGVWRVLDQ